MAVTKVKFTSQSAWETQKQINDNFSDLDTNKVDKDGSKVLSDNNYTDEEKTKLANIESGAQVNVQSDWAQSVASADDFIKNKPTNTSDFINDGDGQSPFATEAYVEENGGKIDSISVNNVPQTIDANKNVNITLPDVVNAEGYANYSALITHLNSATASEYAVGQTFYIQTLEVPDLWVMSVENSSVPYTYTTDAAFITATEASGGQQVGYYKIAQQESKKVDLTNYVQKTTTIAGVDLQDSITVAEMQTALSDTTHRFVTDTEKTTWSGKQDAIEDISFTANDEGWSATADSNGFYTLTITSAKKPIAVYNASGDMVLAGLKYDGTYIYVITDTKFAGVVSAR